MVVAGKWKLSLLIRGHITTDSHNYKNVIMPLRITKMPLWAQNAGPMTWTDWLTWRRRDNDVEMMWQIS